MSPTLLDAPPPLCFPESPIRGSGQSPDAFARFAEEGTDQLTWSPDFQPEPRLVGSEAIQLERRGVTQASAHRFPLKTHTDKTLEFWGKQTTHKNTVAAKLRQAGEVDAAAKLELCHSYYTFAICRECGVTKKFPNRCDQFYCPECQPHLSNERKKQVEWWIPTVQNPWHVVLTVKNIPDLLPAHVDEFRRWWTNLRNRKFCAGWEGGFYSMEVTNEGKGWHLHLHALVSAHFIDSFELSRQWASVTNGMGRIVHARHATGDTYLNEVAKYVVKGSQLAAWTPDQVLTFIRAFTGKRCFGVFGSLYGMRTEFAEWVAELKQQKPKCDCGSCNIRYLSEADYLLLDCQPTTGQQRAQPPPLVECELRLGITPFFPH